MKKAFLISFLAIIGLALASFVDINNWNYTKADAPFEGIVTYSVTTDNEQFAPMINGSSSKVYIKGDKTKTILEMGMMSKQMIFTDQATPDKPVFLVEARGNKYQLKLDNATEEPVITYTNDTKTIAGYVCHKAQLATTDAQGQVESINVYYTEDLVPYPVTYGPLKGLKGFPMEFPINQGPITIQVTATKVNKQSVSDDTFIIPTGYKLVTYEEMFQDLQKSSGAGN